jgi:hypothetical protein
LQQACETSWASNAFIDEAREPPTKQTKCSGAADFQHHLSTRHVFRLKSRARFADRWLTTC